MGVLMGADRGVAPPTVTVGGGGSRPPRAGEIVRILIGIPAVRSPPPAPAPAPPVATTISRLREGARSISRLLEGGAFCDAEGTG